jgi:glutathione S-transferase
MIAAHELGVVDQMTLVRSVAAMLKPNLSLMEVNPLSKIPTLVLDDGSTLWDSVVICEYLNARKGGSLFPEAGGARWQALRWHALGDGMLDTLILWRNEREREVPLPALITAFELKINTAVALLNAETPALSENTFGIGHIALVSALSYIDFRFSSHQWRERAPRLANWFATQQQRNSVRATDLMEG